MSVEINIEFLPCLFIDTVNLVLKEEQGEVTAASTTILLSLFLQLRKACLHWGSAGGAEGGNSSSHKYR